MSSGE
jgi:hypothetical protein